MLCIKCRSTDDTDFTPSECLSHTDDLSLTECTDNTEFFLNAFQGNAQLPFGIKKLFITFGSKAVDC
jgi:hypothetical protein